MNKYNSESYKDQFKPAIHLSYPDIPPLVLTDKLMTRQAAIMLVDIEPTKLIIMEETFQKEIDDLETGDMGIIFKQLFKKK